MIIKKTRLLFLTLFFILTAPTLQAQAIEDYSGTYQGTQSITDFGCTDPADNGDLTASFSVTISQNGNNFTGTAGNRFGTNALTGTVDGAGQATGLFNANDGTGSGGTFAGSFTSTQFQFTSNGTTPSNIDGCFSNSSGTLTKIGGVIGSVAQTQQSRQIIRATNSLISQHLATEVSNAYSFIPGISQNTGAASSDKENWSPDSFWGTSSFSEIHEDNSNIASFDTDIYQFVGGFDKKFGRFFVGSAFTYAYAETEQDGADSNSHVFGITPYGAYQITDYMFISALAGYNYTYVTDESSNTDIDVHDYILESDLNFYKTFYDSIIVKTRLGVRFHHTYVSSLGSALDDSTDELMWLGDFELGYQFQNKLITHVGTYYEYIDRESSANSETVHDGVLYIRGGFDYPLTKTLKLGGKVQADLTDEDTDIITGNISIRLDI